MRIVAGRFRGRKLIAPKDRAIRPTSDRTREALFDILQARIGSLEGRRVLDLFAGTGALGLEALSRGAAVAIFVETGPEARGIIREHIELLGLGGVAKLLRRSATDLGPAGSAPPYDLVFLDPPYGQRLGEKALASARAGGWLEPDATIVLEEAREAVLDLPGGFILDEARVYGAGALHFIRLQNRR